MAVPCVAVLSRFIAESLGESVVSLVSECCKESLDLNGSCPITHKCNPGCFRLWAEDGSSTCIKCKNGTSLSSIVTHNMTECRNFTSRTADIHVNISSTPSVPHSLGNPGIAASLLLGTLFISLFLILSVASFFYLKRSQRLPDIFYRSNKPSILQPSEMASMIPNPKSSVRKPRYVRRERTLTKADPGVLRSPVESKVSNV
ncbi:uncharacterized protein C1orf159 homolog isoform X2 [Bombina bombina]|uniref:uncharacterized protein C1orf159 homolog isoform X2 n=1 Tax=Bombina bombina TaxID=8345 RepID=UPI00235AA046|nr:uncharacterized protein C1orf159 homolog isoform X2 [Bombina bombina]